MKLRYIGWCLLLVCCRPEEKNAKVSTQPAGIDQTISEQSQYASVGLTKLSDYGFFEGKLSKLKPANQVWPYDLNTPLFSDYAQKERFIYLPKGSKIGYQDRDVLDFPMGTVLIKNFYYSAEQLETSVRKIIETRVLIHADKGWQALPYIWNEAQTEAYLEVLGGTVPITLAGTAQIQYHIPDMNQCKSCHDKAGTMTPIGPTIRQLNRKHPNYKPESNQLDQLSAMGWLSLPDTTLPKAPVWNDPQSASLDARARAYLDINCAHCHNEAGPAKNSGLNLGVFEQDLYKLGVNKKPVAAGRGSAALKYGIVPGDAEASILLHRMQSIEPGTMMPELGRTIPHQEGIALIRDWINKM